MNFEKLHNGTQCDCVNGLKEYVEDTFCRKLKSESISEECFHSYWEMGKTVKNLTNCGKVCDNKGVSLHKTGPSGGKTFTIEDIVRHYQISASFSPQNGFTHYCQVRLKPGMGKAKLSPMQGCDFHYDLYKSDAFEHSQLEILSVAKI